ncbi:lipoyl synthase [Prolixibacteraceae bacterium JC049]|nr:lipoyl synthase [Prolixibacteraceae bacterium JC049]
MKFKRKPEWLKIRLPEGENFKKVNQLVKENNLHTICTSGKCPNMGECWGNGTATFMILGNICTRSCKFCNVPTGRPLPPDENEPIKLARSIKIMELKHAVITSVDRDDLEDKGASFWAKCVNTIREVAPGVTLETLVPDFDAIPELLDQIIAVKPEIVSHNLETVERLTPQVRSRAKYRTSLEVIKYLKENGINTKSGIMLGLGETEEEIYQTMDDLLEAGCNILTIGQYLQPSRQHLTVEKYVTPEEFKKYKQIGLDKGFKFVESGPLVRSSYHAEQQI